MDTYSADSSETIIINLYDDWIEILRQSLISSGYDVPLDNSSFDIAIKYFNVELRSISPKVRTVKRASSLTFDFQYQAAINEIQRKAETGEDLRPHLSTLLLKLDFYDRLLNDWGLHHLHLGMNLEKSGFVERGGPLLFAKITDDIFYMVSIRDHNSFSDQSLLEDILSNWPSLLDPFEVGNIINSELPISESERNKFRKANALMITELSNGKFYFPMGGGVTTAGSNIQTVLMHDQWKTALHWIQEDVKCTIDSKRAALPPGVSFGSPPTFRLTFDNNDPVVVEMNSKYGFPYSIT